MTSTMIITPKVQLFSAFTLPDGRRAGFCLENAKHCVYGHPLRSNMSTSGDAVVRCEYKAPPSGKPCNARLYVALWHFGGSAVVRGAGERMWLVVEVSDEQARQLGTVPMTTAEKLIVLNAALPGVAIDVEKASYREGRG